MTFSKYNYLIICSLFVLSGIAALIYQVIWFKQLSYFIGNSTYSQSIVLATYMGGLALGAWFWGKKADSTKKTLFLFAILEISLALYCFFYDPVFQFAENLFLKISVSNSLESDSISVLLLKFLVSGATILLPTILMGGTLPVLVKFLSNRLSDVGKNVSILYFINSLGAVLGTVLAGFYLLQNFGLTITTYIAASLELAVGIISLVMSFFISTKDFKSALPNENEQEKIPAGHQISHKQYKIVIATAAFSGFAAMMYEVIWLRLLIPVLSSSTYSFSLILAAFISGITLGSYLTYKYRNRIQNPLKFVGFCQVGIVVSIFISLPFYERLPLYIWQTINSPLSNSPDYSYYLTIQFIYVFLLILLPTVFMGMTLPVLTRVAVQSLKHSGKIIGNIFAINTLGTVLGSLITGLILIPFIGIYGSLLLAISINILLVLLILFQKNILRDRQKITVGIVVLFCALIFFKNVSAENWAYSIMLSEAPRNINRVNPPETYTEFLDGIKKGTEILYYNEGIGGTIIVGKKKDQIFLSTNGKGDANSVTDLRTQVSLGQTPVILHPHADTVFVIGFGAGTTIGSVLTHPNVKYAEVAEISAEVIEASQSFESINRKPLSRKNLNVIKDDGLSALRLSPHKYDVIISQPSNPWSAGVGNLFTKEFFEECKSKLHPGGYVAQWFSYYEMDDKSLKLILRTALDQFKYISLWHIGKSDILLLCSETPFNFDLNQIEKNYKKVSNELKQINIHSFSAFLSQQLVSSTAGIKKYAGIGELNTEDHPLLELWAPEAFFYDSEPTGFVAIDERKKFEQSSLLLKQYMDFKHGLSPNEILQAGLFQSIGGCKELAYYLADLNPEIYLTWSQLATKAGDSQKAMEYLELANKKKKMLPSELSKQKAEIYGSKGDFTSALNEINKAIGAEPQVASLHYQKGTFHMSLNEFDKGIPALEKAIELDPYMIDAYNNLAIIKGKTKDYRGVIALLDRAVVLSDKNSKIFFNRGYAKGYLNDFKGAVDDFTKSLELEPNNGQAIVLRGRALISMGKRAEACSDFNKAKTLGTPGAQESINQFCNQ